MSSIDELIAAAGRLGVPCLLIGGTNGVHAEDDEDDVTEVAPFIVPGQPGAADSGEVEKLRAQVQKLTAELQQAQTTRPTAPASAAPAQLPGGNLGSFDNLSVETLGFEDETLTKKLMRNGHETIGKARAAFMSGALAEAGFKKDWLIQIGMKLAGAGPSGDAPAPAPTASGGVAASDVPAGHRDRPWQERLAAAKQKQHELDENRAKLAAKQAEMQKLVKAKKDPTEVDDQIIKIEEDITKDEARMVVLRWSMNLDFDPSISLDEALQRANLGPWMMNPQPRIAPAS
jgi:hypothetical protein